MAKTFIFRWNARNQKYYARARTTDRVNTTLFHDRLTYGDDDSQPYIISTNQKANEDMEEKKKVIILGHDRNYSSPSSIISNCK